MADNTLIEALRRSSIGIGILAPDNRWTFVNDRLAEALGASPEALVGEHWETNSHPEDLAESREELEGVRRGEFPSTQFEMRALVKGGLPLWVEVTVASGPHDSRSLLLFFRDTTHRRHSERGWSVQHLVSRILADSPSSEMAIPRILADVGERLHWKFGAFWTPEKRGDGEVLVSRTTWRAPSHSNTEFENSTRATPLRRGEGIPGRAWAEGWPVWETDALALADLPRLEAARAAGLHAAFAFPVRTAAAFYGVIEFFSQDVLPPDASVLNAAEGVGLQIGQFVEREGAELARRTSEIRKASILETALDCVITIDASGIITEFNPAAERTFGYRHADVVGKEMTELIVPPSLRGAHRAGMKRYLTTGIPHVLGRRIEITGMRSDGCEFPVELAIVKVPMPGPVFFTAYLRDLTERRRLEEYQNFLLQASEQLAASLDYETTLNTVAHLAVPGIADWCAVDLLQDDGGLKRVAVAHVDPEKVAAAADLERLFPTDPASGGGVHEVIRTGEARWAADISEEMLRAGTQSDEHLEAIRRLGLKSFILVPLRARGRTLGAMTLVNAESRREFTEADVERAKDLAGRMAIAIDNAQLLSETEESRLRLAEQAEELEATAAQRAEAQEELEVTNEELAATNSELQRKTDEVVRALAAAEQANSAKSQFLATMSHELRTPLNAIGGYAELIKLGIRGPVTEQQKIDLSRIQRSQNQLLTLINDILKFAKLQSGTLEFASTEFSVDEAICHVDDLIRPQMDKKRIDYKYETGDAAVTVCADVDRFQQVMLNLLSNAVKFTGKGGSIGVSWTAGEKDVAINVTDTGIGIPGENLERIFDPFVQVSGSKAKMNEGVGLGLAISREIAERMKGTLTVQSTIGKGSVFTLKIPRGADLRAAKACT